MRRKRGRQKTTNILLGIIATGTGWSYFKAGQTGRGKGERTNNVSLTGRVFTREVRARYGGQDNRHTSIRLYACGRRTLRKDVVDFIKYCCFRTAPRNGRNGYKRQQAEVTGKIKTGSRQRASATQAGKVYNTQRSGK